MNASTTLVKRTIYDNAVGANSCLYTFQVANVVVEGRIDNESNKAQYIYWKWLTNGQFDPSNDAGIKLRPTSFVRARCLGEERTLYVTKTGLLLGNAYVQGDQSQCFIQFTKAGNCTAGV